MASFCMRRDECAAAVVEKHMFSTGYPKITSRRSELLKRRCLSCQLVIDDSAARCCLNLHVSGYGAHVSWLGICCTEMMLYGLSTSYGPAQAAHAPLSLMTLFTAAC